MSCCNCNDITLKTQCYTLLLQYVRWRKSVRVWACIQVYMSMHSNISNSSSMYLKQRWNKIDNCASIETDRYYYYYFLCLWNFHWRRGHVSNMRKSSDKMISLLDVTRYGRVGSKRLFLDIITTVKTHELSS